MANSKPSKKYLDALATNILIYNAEGEITYANPAACKTLGWKHFAAKKHHAGELRSKIITINNKPFKKQPLPIEQVLDQKKAVKEILITLYLGSRRTTLSVDAAPLFKYSSQEIDEVILSFRNITREAQQREFQKVFIKLLGHELKQPLGLIRAYLYYFKKFFQQTDSDTKDYIEKIDNQVTFLTTVFNDITDATRFSLNAFKVNPEPTNLHELLETTLSDIKVVYPSRPITSDFSDVKSITLELDPIRIKQAVSNLLTNAVKYSDRESTIEIKATKKADTITIAITDQGIGLDEDEAALIFEPYYRAKSKKEIKGLGLGLALVKHIAEHHGGTISVTSKKNQGSTFALTLPHA